jgi:hypothetical protein
MASVSRGTDTARQSQLANGYGGRVTSRLVGDPRELRKRAYR